MCKDRERYAGREVERQKRDRDGKTAREKERLGERERERELECRKLRKMLGDQLPGRE